MIGDAIFPVDCDRCGECEQFGGTALAGGAYDARNIPRALRKNGWRCEGEGGETICPECIALEAEDTQP